MKYNDHDLANVLRRILERKGRIAHGWLDISGIAVSVTQAEINAIYDEFPLLERIIDHEVINKQEEFHE